MKREAACSCGQLRVVVEGDPIRVSMCHCLACQRRTGSVFGAQARFAAENVRVEGSYKDYVRISDEGDERTFHFCPECGSTVLYEITAMAGMVAVPVGAFADPGFPEPVFSVWEERRHPWVSVPAGAERMD